MFKKITLATSFVIATMFASSVMAAQISVSKLRVNLENGKTAEFLTLHNESETQKESFEISLHKWTQKENPEGADKVAIEVLDDTNNILVSPKTVVILPKQEKIVRIIVDNVEAAKKDYSHRLIINQLENREVDVQNNTVNLLFKISLPVFVYSDAIKKVEQMNLTHTISEEGGKSFLTIKNNDNQHVQVQEIEVNGKKVSVNHYILPGTTDKIELAGDIVKADLKTKPVMMITDKGNKKIAN